MKIILLAITTLFLSVPKALAHEEGIEITNIAESDWISPLVAIIVIAGAVFISRIIRARSINKPKQQTANQ